MIDITKIAKFVKLAIVSFLVGTGMVAIAAIMGAVQETNNLTKDKMSKYEDDRRSCRVRLGIDYTEVGFRRMIMACAADVQEHRPAIGHERSLLAQKAWDQCMPKLDVCNRALTEDKR